MIFLGYSFSDINIRYMFFRLRRLILNHGGSPPEIYIVSSAYDEITDALFQRYGLTPIYLSEYPGLNTTEKLVSMLLKIVVGAWRVPGETAVCPVVTPHVVHRLEKAIDAADAQEVEGWVDYCVHGIFPLLQIHKLVFGNTRSPRSAYRRWLGIMESAPPRIRKLLTELLVHLRADDEFSVLSEVLLVCYFRYPEVRNHLDDCNVLGWFDPSRNRRPSLSASQLISDANIWAEKGRIQSDTTLYYLLFLHEWFAKSKGYRQFWKRVYSSDPALPAVSDLWENADDLGRLCEGLGYEWCGPTLEEWPSALR